MTMNTTELMKYVYEDVQKHDGFRHFVKASLAERLLLRSRAPKMLHPKPDDEFSMPEIGPHFGIVNEYRRRFVSATRADDPKVNEPLIVEKMSRDGYMLLNGHHRWAAAMMLGLKTVPVKIVNLTHAEDHIRMMEKSNNEKRVIFDFDEVLCVTEAHSKAEEDPHLLFGVFEKAYKERLRWGVPALIHELQRQKFDVWVYTSTYNSVEYIESFFKAYKLEVDGIINGVGRKKSKKAEQEYREMVAKKYKLIYNVDHDGVLCIHPAAKHYDNYEVTSTDVNWANKVMEVIRQTSGDDK